MTSGKKTDLSDLHSRMMELALAEAKKGIGAGEIPVGAVVYDDSGKVWGRAHNGTIAGRDPTAHAEFAACQAAARAMGDMYLLDCHVAVTLEPCAMCAQALSYFRVKSIYFGAYDVKSGGTVNGARVLGHAHHKPEVIGGLMEAPCAALLTDFFKEKRP
jgi:tRNA(adenine34) deaminase